MSKMDDMHSLLERKEKQKGKIDTLEKNDFKALLIAGFSVFGPVLIGMLVFFAIIVYLFVLFVN